jgi:hypothetical protein
MFVLEASLLSVPQESGDPLMSENTRGENSTCMIFLFASAVCGGALIPQVGEKSNIKYV